MIRFRLTLLCIATMCLLAGCSAVEDTEAQESVTTAEEAAVQTTTAEAEEVTTADAATTVTTTVSETVTEEMTTTEEVTATTTAEVTTTAETVTTTAAATTTTITKTTTTAAATTTAKKTTTSVKTTTTAKKLPDGAVLNCMKTVEVYDEIKISDFVTKTNTSINGGSALLDTSSTGAHTVKISYTYGGKKYTQTVNYTVADTTDPTILAGGWTVNHLKGTDFDLNNYVSYADNYDKSPSLSYSGKVDTNKVGTYNITATVKDSSGNKTSWSIKVNVIDKFPSYEDGSTENVKYSDFIKKYDNGNVRFGIDVSKWQGDIDFDAVRDAGCSFVIMRIGSYYDEMIMDEYFVQNIKNATAAGLDIGVYYYSTDSSIKTAKENAKWIAQQLGDYKLEMPVVFDWENFSRFQQYGMSIHDLNEVYLAFAKEIEKYGYSAMLYGSKNYLNTIWEEKTKSAHPVWLAHYTDKTDYDGDYAIWQASCVGRIPGINADVDMDIQYLDRPID